MRLRAWWDGYDAAALSARMSARQADDTGPVDIPFLPELPLAETDDTIVAKAVPDWDAARLTAAQLVWGKSSIAPKGEARLRSLALEFGLSKASSIVHLGADLGGTALMLQRGIGCRVLPADTVDTFVAASGQRVTLLGQNDRPLADDVDIMLVDHFAERGEPLVRILRTQGRGLGKTGRLVIRALVKQSGSRRDDALLAWMESEPIKPRLRSADELQRIVQEAGLVLNASRNASEAYVDEIETAWRGAVDNVRTLHGRAGAAAIGDMLLSEGERWAARAALIADGTLCYREVIASRRN